MTDTLPPGEQVQGVLHRIQKYSTRRDPALPNIFIFHSQLLPVLQPGIPSHPAHGLRE